MATYDTYGNPINPGGGGAVPTASSPFTGIAQLLGGIGSLATANSDMGFAREAMGIADPWSSNRGAYQTMLNTFMGNAANNPMNVTQRSNTALDRLMDLMANPNQITSMPGYQFGMSQALESVNRAAGASGLLNSGNRLIALEDRGQKYAGDWYDKTVNQLMGLIGESNQTGQLGLNAQGQGFNQREDLAGVRAGSPTAAADALLYGNRARGQAIGAGAGGIASGI